MKKSDLENRIKALELELSIFKSGGLATKTGTKHPHEDFDVRFLTLANHIPANIAYINADTLRCEFVNNLFEKSFGIPKEKIIESHIKDVIGETNYKFALKYINEVKLGQSCSYENTFNLISGKRWLQVNYSPVFDSKSKVIGIILVSYDITDSKKTEEIVNQNIGAWELNLVDGAAWRSLKHDQIFGYDTLLPEWTFDMFIEHVIPDDREVVKGKFENAIATGTEWDFECRILRKDGIIFWIWAKGNPVLNESGEPVSMKGIVQDINERKKAELELIKAKEKAEESDRLKSAFLTNMSHEIRTPMNGILGFAELLKEPHLSNEEQSRFIEIIGQSGQRMLNTINSIIEISKIESGQVKVVIKEANINSKMEFTHKFLLPLADKQGIQLTFKNGLPDKESNIKTDNEKVYGILTNLVRNAIKFTSKGSIEFGYTKKGEFLEFYVKDTGIGLSRHQKEIIFERFRQGSESYNREYEGSGLGLSISKSFVEMLGGRIWVESQEGKGSTFYYTIPYNVESDVDTKTNDSVFSESEDVQVSNLKILIVEDDEISYSLLSLGLEEISANVLHAITGIEAVDACRNNSDLDLVLMDIRMPEMNGLEATRQIRQFNKELVIIAQTAYGFESDSKMALEAGCTDYISKPIEMALLNDMIKKHCNK